MRMLLELEMETETAAPPGEAAGHAAAIPVLNAMWESARLAIPFWTAATAATRANDVAGKLLVAAGTQVARSAAWVCRYPPQAVDVIAIVV